MIKKINAAYYDSDKSELTHYIHNYEENFEKLVDKEIKLLELGVAKGGSLLLWRDYFEKGIIVGLDVNQVEIADPTGRIRLYQGYQQDTSLLDRIALQEAPEGFDVIIDDCSHIGAITRISFWHLFDNHLKPGGLYIIEDWGTGYWDRWIDGKHYRPNAKDKFHWVRFLTVSFIQKLLVISKLQLLHRFVEIVQYYKKRMPSHDYGMVGFIKQLVDECGMDDITHPKWGIASHHSSKIHRMQISHGQVIIMKSYLPK